MSYLRFDNKIVTDLTDTSITSLYNQGYVFIRTTKGAMDQTRSVRIDLSVFEPSSENRRIIRKMTEQHITLQEIPLPYVAYHWEIGKMGKTFYDEKFGPKTFSANKIKEVLTNKAKSNFTTLFVYKQHDIPVGYCIVYQNEDMIHYSYPFYNEEIQNLSYHHTLYQSYDCKNLPGIDYPSRICRVRTQTQTVLTELVHNVY